MHLKTVSISVAAMLALSTAAACSSSKSGGGSSNSPANGASSGGAAPSGVPDPSKQPKSKVKAVTMSGDCADYGKYGKYPGTKVTVYTSITQPEISYHINSVKQFEKCTGITVQYSPSKEFEAALKTKVDGGNAPDLAF